MPAVESSAAAFQSEGPVGIATWLGTTRSSRHSTCKRVRYGRAWACGFRFERGLANLMVNPSDESTLGPRYTDKVIDPGARTERRGGAGPAGGLLGGKGPAGRFGPVTPRRTDQTEGELPITSPLAS